MFDLSRAQRIFIAVGFTDLRQGIDGFVTLVQNTFHMNPQTSTLFMFCGRRSDRIKALFWDGDGYILLYKRLETGRYQWPWNENELKELTMQKFRWLMEGLNIYQKKVIQPIQRQLLY